MKKRTLAQRIAGAPYILSVPNYNRTPVLLGLIAVVTASDIIKLFH